MFSEFADEKHRGQVEEFLLELGRFTIAFERVCEAMRYAIMFMLRSEGLKNQGMEQVIIGDTASAQLQVLLGALYAELPNQSKPDAAEVKYLLKEVKELTEKRNVVLHSPWQFGSEAAEAELHVGTVRYKTKQNQGSAPEIHEFSSQYLRDLTTRLKVVQVKMQRLQYCITQSGFSVAVEFGKPM